MNVEAVSQKQLNELERLTRELLEAMRKAKLQNEPITESLRTLERELGELRRTRFDASYPQYQGY